MRAFDAVATKRSFSLAAVEVGASQSTVSQRIARLEKRLNRRLVSRTTRKVSLTPDGEAMLIYARSILALSNEARSLLARPGLKGILKVGIEDEFARTRLPEVLGIFRAQFPDFGLKFITGRNEHLHDVLRSHEVDVILGKRHGDSDGVALWQEQLVWVGHRSLQLKPSDPVPLVSYIKPSLTRALAESVTAIWPPLVDRCGRVQQSSRHPCGRAFGPWGDGHWPELQEDHPRADPPRRPASRSLAS